VQPRHFVQESVVIERQPVGDLVQHGQLGPAQEVGLPQRQHRAAQLLLAGLEFLRCQVHAFAAIEQRSDFHLAVDGALASHLGRMRGQDRANCAVPKNRRSWWALMPASRACASVRASVPTLPAEFGRASAGCCSGPRRYWRGGKIAEGADDAHGFGGRHAVEGEFQLTPRHPVLVAMEPDRGLPDAFDQVEYVHPS